MKQLPSQVHQFHRHPQAPWLELRVSLSSPHCFRLHAHDEYSIGIIDGGQALFSHADGPERVRQGSVVLIEPGRWHACNPDEITHWSYRMLFVKADWLHAQLQLPALRFPARALHDAASSDIAHQLCQPLAAADDIAAHTSLLLSFLRANAEVDDQSIPAQAIASNQAIRHAVEQLHAQPQADTTVASLAQACGMSASRFIRHFKAATGVTPGAYRLNLRLNGARRLLAQGAALADAAHSMGFADQAHLQRSFKAHHALTPGRYALGANCPPSP
ncbi:helix-turn-helix domain-containing protein [Comamonas sp. GB3 AK4-5]|uniref:AraC family transcriptional regulator n=1 Tax=Comamonas sp. GB3 AK4-5 TaxID=3231487 RepID=UPI00351E8F2A